MNRLDAAVPRSNVHDLSDLRERLAVGAEPGAEFSASDPMTTASDRRLLAVLPVAVYLTDAAGRITFFNQAAETLWGRRPRLGIDRYCGSWRILADDRTPLPHDRIATAIALKTGKQVTALERIIVRPDGSWARVSAFPTLLYDEAGAVTGAIVLLVDATASEAAAAELKESQEHCLSASALNPQMPWTASPEGEWLEVSQRWCAFIGRTQAEALRSDWHDVVNRGDVQGMREAIAKALTSGQPYDARYRVLTASGEERWVRSRAAPRRDAEGAIVRWYGFTEDIHDAVLMEEEARVAGLRHNLISQAADDVGWDNDLTNDLVIWTPTLERRLGVWPEGGRSSRAWWLERIHADDRARVLATIAASLTGSGIHHKAEYRFRRGDGSYAHVLDRGTLIRDEGGRVIRAVGAMIDLTERKNSEDALRLSEERFRLAATAAGIGVADIDLVTGEKHWSSQMRVILGLPTDAVAGPQTYLPLIHPDERAAASARHYRDLRGDMGTMSKSVYRIIRPRDGATRWLEAERHAIRDDAGKIVRIIITNRDITEEKTAQDRINWAATHDALTGLPNRSAFQARFERALADARRETAPLGLLLIDLDNFKYVNDLLGHQAGDRALAAFARRIREAMPPGAIVVRFGGDEFAAILPGADAAAAAAAANDLTLLLQRPASIGDRNLDLRASIGVAAFPSEGEDATELVQNADLALYAAKAGGGSAMRTFEPSLRTSLKQQLSMLSQARAALDHGWIRPFYQPKISLATGRTVGFEALLRWRDPATGLKLPATIAGAFDDTELAGLIGGAMLSAVLADMRDWDARGIAAGKIAINASAAEFRGPGFAERLLARMADFGVPPAMLELEITETAFLGDCAANVIVALETLRAAGMTIALDDFGTGFSSLSHLRSFPVDAIKIDRSFVAGLSECAEDGAIVEAILRLGEGLGMTTVAEGVETRAQADLLRANGCTLAQGFLYAAALDAGEVPGAVLRSYSRAETDSGDAEVD